MASKRGAANLARYNTIRSANTVPMLEAELKRCRKHRLEFGSAGRLAHYLQDRIGVNRTTLIRNPTYFALLQEHLAGPPRVLSEIPDETLDPIDLQAKLTASQVEVSNLRATLAQMRSQLERYQLGTVSSGTNDGGATAFSNLAMVLVNLLHRFPDFIQFDRHRRELLDLSAKPSERQIAGKQRLGSFVRWMELNQSLPMVEALVLGGPQAKEE